MSTPRSRDEYLGDIVAWGDRVSSYVDGLDYPAFVASTLIQDAVIRCLEIMGEASGNVLRLDPSVGDAHPDLQLAEAYRSRNRTAHGYGSVNLQIVWASATVSAPALVAGVRKIRASG